MNKTPGLSITGYVTADGVLHPFAGTVTVEADTLVFHPVSRTTDAAYPAHPTATFGTEFRLPQTEVTSLNRIGPNNVNIILITVGTVAAIGGLAALIWELEEGH